MASIKTQNARAFETEEQYEYLRFLAGNHLMVDCGDGDVDWMPAIDIFHNLQTEVPEDYPIHPKYYYGNQVIQQSLVAIGIDPDKMWHTIRFMRYMSEDKFVDAHPLYPSMESRVRKFLAAISEGATVIRIEQEGEDGKKGKVIDKFSDEELTRHLRELIRMDIETNAGDPGFSASRFDLQEKVTFGINKQIAYEARLYLEVFERFCTDQDQPKRTKGPSRDKLLLTSRLMYLTNLTTNLSFWKGRDALKGVMRKCQNDSSSEIASSKHWI